MKIFIAVGTQLPFDRLIRTVDAWAAEHTEHEVFAQTGPTEYRAQHLQTERFVPPHVFEKHSKEADLLITHAGTGSIFLALELCKPIIVMPRLAKHKEHRNDHQLATVERFQDLPGVNVAWDEHELRRLLDDLDTLDRPDGEFRSHAQPDLLETISQAINEAPRPRKRDRLTKLLRSLKP